MRNLLGSLIAAICMIGTSSAFAHGDRPCAPVFKACAKAPANKGNREAIKECVKTIKGGGTVPGVDVTASEECKNSPPPGK